MSPDIVLGIADKLQPLFYKTQDYYIWGKNAKQTYNIFLIFYFVN